jgi:hypothetical protein
MSWNENNSNVVEPEPKHCCIPASVFLCALVHFVQKMSLMLIALFYTYVPFFVFCFTQIDQMLSAPASSMNQKEVGAQISWCILSPHYTEAIKHATNKSLTIGGTDNQIILANSKTRTTAGAGAFNFAKGKTQILDAPHWFEFDSDSADNVLSVTFVDIPSTLSQLAASSDLQTFEDGEKCTVLSFLTKVLLLEDAAFP